MDHRVFAVAFQKLLFDQIDVRDLRREFFDVAVILDNPYGTTRFAIAAAVSASLVAIFSLTSLYCIRFALSFFLSLRKLLHDTLYNNARVKSTRKIRMDFIQ